MGSPGPLFPSLIAQLRMKLNRGQGMRLACKWSGTETATILTLCTWFHSSRWFDHSSVVALVPAAVVVDNSIEVVDGRIVWSLGCF